jgi:hypothetical protein
LDLPGIRVRVIFGAAALSAMKQDKADAILDLLLEYGVNHIDTAVADGDLKLRIGSWMREHRARFFLATKTGDRTYESARASLVRSLERLKVDQIDPIQLQNLVEEADWQTAFDSVLFLYNFTMLRIDQYLADAEALIQLCSERSVAIQTIKSAARQRWQNGNERKFSWDEPLRDRDALRRAVGFVLSRPGLFLNSSSGKTILRYILEVASEPAAIQHARRWKPMWTITQCSRFSFPASLIESDIRT